MKLQQVLERYYYEERNVQISSFWDGGWTIKIGDSHNGFIDEKNFDELDDAAAWLSLRLDEILNNDVDSQPSPTALT